MEEKKFLDRLERKFLELKRKLSGGSVERYSDKWFEIREEYIKVANELRQHQANINSIRGNKVLWYAGKKLSFLKEVDDSNVAQELLDFQRSQGRVSCCTHYHGKHQVFSDLNSRVFNITLKGGHKMAKVLNSKGGTRNGSKANGNVSKDASSPELEKLSKAITSTVNKIVEQDLAKENGKTTSPKILKKKKPAKTAKEKRVAKKVNGQKRLQKKAQLIKSIVTAHGTEIKRIWKKDQKRQSVVKAMAKHGLTESQVYQTMNYLNLIKTAGATKKLARMKEAGLL